MRGTFYEYHLRELHTNRTLGEPTTAGDDFLSRAKRAILEGAQRLDELPTEDSFWQTMDGSQIWAYLRSFFQQERQQNPCNERALWGEIALDQWNSSGYLSVEEWRQLHRCGMLEVRWVVHSAYYIAAALSEYASYRSCLSRDLVYFLRDLELVEASQPVLDAYRPKLSRSPSSWLIRCPRPIGSVESCGEWRIRSSGRGSGRLIIALITSSIW